MARALLKRKSSIAYSDTLQSRFSMLSVLDFGLAALLLTIIALVIAALGDHVAQVLSNTDPWPDRIPKRSRPHQPPQ